MFLAVGEDANAKRKAGQVLLDVLVDLWDRYDAKAFHYRDCIFFAQPGEPAAWGNAQKWRLGCYPDAIVERVE